MTDFSRFWILTKKKPDANQCHFYNFQNAHERIKDFQSKLPLFINKCASFKQTLSLEI